MTPYQRQLFGQILDLNYEIHIGNHSEIAMDAMVYKMERLQREMEEDMGVEEWKEFKDKGKRMFQPA